MFRYKIAVLASVFTLHFSLHAGWTPAKYSGEFLSVGMGARALGMGSAHAALANDVTALYWNPAGLSRMQTWQAHAMHSERFAGTVNWDVIGLGIPMRNGRSLAIGFLRLGVDDIPYTKLLDPNRQLGEVYVDATGQTVRNVPYVDSYMTHSESAFYLSYALRKNDQWAFGLNVKTLFKKSGFNDAWGLGFDAGVQYQMFSNLRLGAMLSDGTGTLVAWDTGRKEMIRPKVTFGAASSVHWKTFEFAPACDMEINLENRGDANQLSMGRAGIDFRAGFEVQYKKLLAIRLGADRGYFATGAGFTFKGLALDYGFSPHEDLGNTHRISVTLFRNPFKSQRQK